MYQVPPDMSEKEKVIGGILNINQFFWLLAGGLVGAGIGSIAFPLIGGKGALVFGFLFALSGTPFVFFKKKDLTLYQYLKYKRAFKHKTHKLPNIRKDV